MKINGKNWKTIWITNDLEIEVIDQTLLPHKFEIKKFKNIEDTYFGIKNMIVRGAPLIGVTGGYGFALGIKENPSDDLNNKKLVESSKLEEIINFILLKTKKVMKWLDK